MRIGKFFISAIVTFGLAVPLATSAAEAGPKQERVQVAARQPRAVVREQAPPEMSHYQRRQLFKHLGNENPGLVNMLATCGDKKTGQVDLFCLTSLIKAREETRDEQRKQDLATDMVMGMIASMLPSVRRYVAELRDEAAKSGDTEYAGKFSVAAENIIKASESYADLAAYLTKKRQSLEAKDKYP